MLQRGLEPMGKVKASHVAGVFVLIFFAIAAIAVWIPTILRSTEVQAYLLFLFIGGCLAYFYWYEWPKRKVQFPR